jgi:hypothetical protein
MKESIKDLVDRLCLDKEEDLPPPVFTFRGVPAPSFHEVGSVTAVDINEKSVKKNRVSETRIGGLSDSSSVRGASFVGNFLGDYLGREREKEASRNAESLFFVTLSMGSSVQASEVYADLKRSKDERIKVYGYFRSSLEMGVVGITQEDAVRAASSALESCGYQRSLYYFHKVTRIS